MDAYSTESDLSYSDLPPVFIAGSSDTAIVRARATVESFRLRIAGAMPLVGAAARLQQQASATAVWVELDDSSTCDIIDELVDQLNADVRGGRYGVVVSASTELIDPLASSLDDDVQLLIGANDAERLRQLSDEVSRIAATLARLSTGPATAPRQAEAPRTADLPPLSADTVRAVIRARRLRARYFPEELFADPAWDMLLDLLQAEISHLRVPVSSLCIAAAVPATTALRWLKTLVQQGIFVRRADPHDGRRVFVELAPNTSNALRRYFADVGHVAVI